LGVFEVPEVAWQHVGARSRRDASVVHWSLAPKFGVQARPHELDVASVPVVG